MFDYDRDELKTLLEEHGFDVVLMDRPQQKIKHHYMRVYTRRVFEKENLETELKMLHNIGIRTIGLYTVGPAYVFHEDGEDPEAEGSTIRWAYHKGI